VKVIFVPCYLDGRDGIMNKSYYDLEIGNDICIFASYYEPWGYTPLESVAFHVPTVTTDLAGFGRWVEGLQKVKGIEDGVEVLHRSDYNYFEVADGVKDTILRFSQKTPDEVKDIRHKATLVAERALWKHFIKYYFVAYDVALRKSEARINKK
jgi:glycogen synthase